MTKFIIDASFNGNTFCFCPIKEDGDSPDGFIVEDVDYIQDEPPGEVVGVWSSEGQEEIDEFVENNKDRLRELRNNNG